MGDYFVDGEDILENKLGIEDPVQLKEIETEVVYARLIELTKEEYDCEFNFDLLKDFHYHLFSDLYYMAGNVRTVRISKGGSVFCYPENILSEQERIFEKLKKEHYLRGLNKDVFIKKFAELSAELNALHPFREGNGRAIKAFLFKLAQAAGWHVNYSGIDAARLMEADIEAFYGDTARLAEIIAENTTEWN